MVILREFEQNDIGILPQLANNINVTRYLTTSFPSSYTIEDAEWWVNVGCKQGIIAKAIEVNHKLAGSIGVTPGKYNHILSAEIGYWLGEEYWGKGIATEAVRKMTAYTFSNTDIVRLFAPVFSPNNASMKVLEKCNYTLEGILKKATYKDGLFYDEHLYARIQS